jgi:hypothetical protein
MKRAFPCREVKRHGVPAKRNPTLTWIITQRRFVPSLLACTMILPKSGLTAESFPTGLSIRSPAKWPISGDSSVQQALFGGGHGRRNTDQRSIARRHDGSHAQLAGLSTNAHGSCSQPKASRRARFSSAQNSPTPLMRQRSRPHSEQQHQKHLPCRVAPLRSWAIGRQGRDRDGSNERGASVLLKARLTRR